MYIYCSQNIAHLGLFLYHVMSCLVTAFPFLFSSMCCPSLAMSSFSRSPSTSTHIRQMNRLSHIPVVVALFLIGTECRISTGNLLHKSSRGQEMLISNKLSETQPKEPKHIDVIAQTNSHESNLRLLLRVDILT